MSNWKDVVPVDAGAGAVPAWANGVPDCPPAWAPPKGTPAPAPEVEDTEDAEEAKGAGAAAPAGPDAPSDAPPACQPSSKASRRSQAMSTTPSGPRSASS